VGDAMEMTIYIAFTTDKHADVLAAAFKGLSQQNAGAIFQEHFSVFGEAVEAELERMMAEWPMEYFYAEKYSRKGKRISVSFLTASDGEFFADDMEAFLELCGATNVRTKFETDDDCDDYDYDDDEDDEG